MQGCSLPVLVVNVVYSAFAHVQRIATDVSCRSFIDDAKMWTAKEAVDDLAGAFDGVDAFDPDIGQVANPCKTFAVTRKESVAKRFLKKKTGKQSQVKRTIKSLDFFMHGKTKVCKCPTEAREADGYQGQKKKPI